MDDFKNPSTTYPERKYQNRFGYSNRDNDTEYQKVREHYQSERDLIRELAIKKYDAESVEFERHVEELKQENETLTYATIVFHDEDEQQMTDEELSKKANSFVSDLQYKNITFISFEDEYRTETWDSFSFLIADAKRK